MYVYRWSTASGGSVIISASRRLLPIRRDDGKGERLFRNARNAESIDRTGSRLQTALVWLPLALSRSAHTGLEEITPQVFVVGTADK